MFLGPLALQPLKYKKTFFCAVAQVIYATLIIQLILTLKLQLQKVLYH